MSKAVVGDAEQLPTWECVRNSFSLDMCPQTHPMSISMPCYPS